MDEFKTYHSPEELLADIKSDDPELQRAAFMFTVDGLFKTPSARLLSLPDEDFLTRFMGHCYSILSPAVDALRSSYMGRDAKIYTAITIAEVGLLTAISIIPRGLDKRLQAMVFVEEFKHNMAKLQQELQGDSNAQG